MRKVHIFLTLGMLAFLAAGCKSAGESSGKPVVTVQCNPVSEDYQLAVERQCPDIEIKWFLSTQIHHNLFNNISEVPDILCMSSFYANQEPAPYLKDISGNVDISDYSRNVIDNFMRDDGSIYWIPVVGNAHFIVANKALFEKYGVEYPHDYKSLVEADRKFKSNGVDGLQWGMSHSWPYSAFLTAQVLAADMFNSYDGMVWRKNLRKASPESDYTLDDECWPEVFRRFREACDNGLIEPSDFDDTDVNISERVRFGKAAMALTSSKNLTGFGEEDFEVIPVCDSQGCTWVPIYMGLCFAMSNSVTDKNFPYVKRVLEALRSKESLKAYNDSRGGAYPLDYDTSEVPEAFSKLKKATEKGFSFLFFNELNSGTVEGFYDAAREMVDQDLTAQQAYDRCKEYILKYRADKAQNEETLNSGDPDKVVFVSNKRYSALSDANSNNPEASCLANSILASINSLSEKKTDILVTLPLMAGAPMEKGPYFLDRSGELSYGSNLFFLFSARRCFYPATMTVAELIQYLNNSFYYYHRIDDGLPVMAGASYEIDKYEKGIADENLPFTPGTVNAGKIANVKNFPTRYVCKSIIKDGQALDSDQVVEVVIARENAFYMTELTKDWESNWAGFRPQLKIDNRSGKSLTSSADFFVDWVSTGHAPCEPTRYLYINDVKK